MLHSISHPLQKKRNLFQALGAVFCFRKESGSSRRFRKLRKSTISCWRRGELFLFAASIDKMKSSFTETHKRFVVELRSSTDRQYLDFNSTSLASYFLVPHGVEMTLLNVFFPQSSSSTRKFFCGVPPFYKDINICRRIPEYHWRHNCVEARGTMATWNQAGATAENSISGNFVGSKKKCTHTCILYIASSELDSPERHRTARTIKLRPSYARNTHLQMESSQVLWIVL